MKEDVRKTLNKKVYRPANRIVDAFLERPYPSLAALATLGVGLAYFMSGNKQSHGSYENPSTASQHAADKESYFDAAPRSISGSHRSYESYAGEGGGISGKGKPLLIGSAAVLTGIYLFGKKK